LQYRTPFCQPETAEPGVLHPFSSPDEGASSPVIESPFEHSAGCGGGGLLVAAAEQWVATTASRLAADSYSWMQAVHWVHGAGVYVPARKTGPRFCETTVRVAELVSALAECRPGVDWIARKLKVSERTVQYHLGMLREAGLLVYVSMPQWAKGEQRPREAAEFARVIPPVFDEALGIRTVIEDGRPAAARRAVGVAERGRKLIGDLAKKAARKVRKKRRTGGVRCTPVQVPQVGTTSAASTTSPSEAKLASGADRLTTPKSSKSGRRPRRLNAVGRRHQLAGELVQRVPWLGHLRTEGRDRIAWQVRDVADAGWTAEEVIAWLDLGAAAADVRRPSGFLAARLRGATTIWATPQQRNAGRAAAADSRRAEQARHADREHTGLNVPTSRAAAARIMQALRQGVAAYKARQAAQGLDDLMPVTLPDDSEAAAAADFAAFLGQPIGAAL
jgi:DNA-binding transcriptional ArsR family regulator